MKNAFVAMLWLHDKILDISVRFLMINLENEKNVRCQDVNKGTLMLEAAC